MPRSMPIYLSGFEMSARVVEELAALVGARALALAEADMREFQAATEYDPVRWGGYDREWTLAGLDGRLELGAEITWSPWDVVSAEGIAYSSSTRISAHPPTSDLLDGARAATFTLRSGFGEDSHGVEIDFRDGFCTATVEAPEASIRELTTAVRALLEEHATPEAPAPAKPFRVFIAYGGGRMWEVVRDYLERAGFAVDAFTESERASQLTIDVVSGMIHSASLAVIVMTAADQIGEARHARQNVVHELGFSQGVLGLQRTVLLKEEGVTLPSNLDGMTFIPFLPGEIHTTRERVVNIARAARADHQAGFA